MSLNHIYKKYLLLSGAMITIFLLVNVLSTNSLRKVFIDGDGSGHYAYLPSIIIYNTVDFTQVFDFEKTQRPPDYMGHYFHKYENVFINKYTSGTALLQLPFFLLAYIISLIIGLTPDGYNVVFQYFSALSAIFWVSLGLIYLVKLLQTYSIDKKFGWLISIIGLLGTNLFFYTFIQPSFSHAYSFSIITIFAYYIRLVFIDYSRFNIIVTSFLLGIIILIRPANILVVSFIPFLSGSWKNLIEIVRKKVVSFDLIFAIISLIIAISPQLIINYLQTGSVIIYGYKGEGFYFDNPQVINFLFSYRKGWFVYTPLFLLLVPGILYLWRSQTKFTFFSFVLFFGILIYVFSSWWNWYYGDSFGMRPMVDYYSIFLVVIAIFIYNTCRSWVKKLAFGFMVITIVLNLIQSYQYAVGIIHADSMTKKAYWYVFLDLNKDKVKSVSCGDETFFGELNDVSFHRAKTSIESVDEGWTDPYYKTSKVFFSDSLSIVQNPKLIYSPSYKYIIADSLIGYDNIFIRFNTKYYEQFPNNASKAVFVVDITDSTGKNVFYKSFRVKKIPDNIVNEWKLGTIGFKLPVITSDMEYIKLYVWNVDKKSYYLDDLEVMFYTYDSN